MKYVCTYILIKMGKFGLRDIIPQEFFKSQKSSGNTFIKIEEPAGPRQKDLQVPDIRSKWSTSTREGPADPN